MFLFHCLIFTLLSLPYIIPAAWQEFSGRDLHLLHVSCQVVRHPLRQGAEAARHPLRQGAEGSRERGGAFKEGKDREQAPHKLIHHLWQMPLCSSILPFLHF